MGCRWNRQWTAEENRHGDLMNKYCYLSGRVNMKAVERTIQNLIGSGMDPKTENNPYLGFIYTSFQERATKVRQMWGQTMGHSSQRTGWWALMTPGVKPRKMLQPKTCMMLRLWTLCLALGEVCLLRLIQRNIQAEAGRAGIRVSLLKTSGLQHFSV